MSFNSPVTIIILIDGFGWSLSEETGFLTCLLPFRNPVQPVRGYSSAAIPALLTGLPPDKTGKWMLFGRNQSGTGNLRAFSRIASLTKRYPEIDRSLRRLLTWWLVRVRQWPLHFSFFQIPLDLCRDLQFEDIDMRWAPPEIGGYPSLFAKIEQKHLPLHLYGFPTPDQLSLRAAETLVMNRQKGIYMLYLWQMDSAFHAIFHDSLRLKALVDQYESGIHHLYETAQNEFGSVNLVILSDHGMTPVIGGVDVMALLQHHPRLKSVSPLVFYNSTLLQVWCDDRSKIPVVRDVLTEIPYSYLLSEEQMRQESIYLNDCRFGDLFVQMKEGWVVQPCYFSREIPAGMHGYDPTLANSLAVCLSNVDMQQPVNLYEVHDSLLRLIL